jgi:hypothetical protein
VPCFWRMGLPSSGCGWAGAIIVTDANRTRLFRFGRKSQLLLSVMQVGIQFESIPRGTNGQCHFRGSLSKHDTGEGLAFHIDYDNEKNRYLIAEE